MSILVHKRDGRKEILDITKIQKMTSDATYDLDGVSQSALELDAQIKFINGMKSSDIQDSLIKTAVEKIDIDVPNWTFVAARLFLYDLYHKVGRTVNGIKGRSYPDLDTYINNGIKAGRLNPSLANGYDVTDLSDYIRPERDFQFNYLGIKTLYDRYLIKNAEGECIELPQQMFMGIAMFLAQNEIDKQTKAKEFYDVISKFEVMLATPTLSNARTTRHQLSSCYIGKTPDNIEGIFDAYHEQALLSKFGGGIGWDWTWVRGMGGVIDNHKSAAGGTVPFLKINNDTMVAVDQLGTRKGACAVNMEPWHIDILDFIELKKNSGEERRRTHELFPTVWISDLFMQRILNDELWTLFDPYDVPLLEGLFGEAFEAQYVKYEADKSIKNTITMKAKDLWKKVLTNYFESGNPFLAFKDTANKANPNNHSGVIYSTNLCTEIFQNTSANQYLMKAYIEDGINNDKFVSFKESAKVLLDNGIIKEGKKVTSLDSIVSIDGIEFPKGPYKVYCVEKEKINGETAVCNLASVNLGKINTKLDIERVVPIAVNMLDNVIDLNYYPLKKVKDTNMKSRAIGLGVMGEAEMLATKGIHFGSIEHLNIIDNIMEMISFNTIKSSSKLGLERGSYPNFENSKWNNGVLPIDIANTEAIELTNANNKIYSEKEYIELRDMVSKSMRNGYLMAIAPTSSISILVGTTQCIEPVYKRKWYEENLSGLIPVVVPKLSPDTYEFYTSAYDIEQFDIIRAAAVRQKWIDQGQSINIFMRLDKSSGKYLHEIYTLAWKLGLKSTYYLRSQSPESSSATMDIADRSIECVGCQ